MGWFSNYLWKQKEDVIKELDSGFTNNAKLVRSSTVGNNHWQLIELDDGKRLIVLNILNKNPNGIWSYKPIDEEMGPLELNCPVTILNQATETDNEFAKKWRRAAYAYHEERKQIRAFREGLQPGDWIEYGDKIYMLDESLGRRGWLVNGFLLMSNQQINAAIKNHLEGKWSSKGYLYFELGKESRSILEDLQAGDTITLLDGNKYVLNEKVDGKDAWLAVGGDGEERLLESKTLLSTIFDELLEEHNKQEERNQTRSRPSM